MKFHLCILSMDDNWEEMRAFAFTGTSDKACGFPGKGGIQPQGLQHLCEGSLDLWFPIVYDKGPRRQIYWPTYISQRAAGFQACSSFADDQEPQACTCGLLVGREGWSALETPPASLALPAVPRVPKGPAINATTQHQAGTSTSTSPGSQKVFSWRVLGTEATSSGLFF